MPTIWSYSQKRILVDHPLLVALVVFFLLLALAIVTGLTARARFVEQDVSVLFSPKTFNPYSKEPVFLFPGHTSAEVDILPAPINLAMSKFTWDSEPPLRIASLGEKLIRIYVDPVDIPQGAAVRKVIQARLGNCVAGQLEVLIGAGPEIEEVQFTPEHVILTREEPSANPSFNVRPDLLPEKEMARLQFQVQPPNISVKVARDLTNPKVLNVKMAEQPQFLTDAELQAIVGQRVVGRLPLQLTAESEVKQVRFEPELVHLSADGIEHQVEFSVVPENVSKGKAEALEFVANQEGVVVERRDKSLFLRANPGSTPLDRELNFDIIAKSQELVVGRLAVIVMPVAKATQILFTPETVELAPLSNTARVKLTPFPADSNMRNVIWIADSIFSARFVPQSNELEVSYNPDKIPANSTVQATVHAQCGAQELGSLPVVMRGKEEMTAKAVPKAVQSTASFNIDSIKTVYSRETSRGNKEVIAITAENPTPSSYIGTIAVSIFGGKPIIEKSLEYSVYEPGTLVTLFDRVEEYWLPAKNKTRTSVTLVELYDAQWSAHSSRTLTFPIEFSSAGTVTLRVRVTFAESVRPGLVRVVENFPQDGSTDQQGLPIYDLTIEVRD